MENNALIEIGENKAYIETIQEDIKKMQNKISEMEITVRNGEETTSRLWSRLREIEEDVMAAKQELEEDDTEEKTPEETNNDAKENKDEKPAETTIIETLIPKTKRRGVACLF